MTAATFDPVSTAGHMDAAAVIFDLQGEQLLANYCRAARTGLLAQATELQTLKNRIFVLEIDLAAARGRVA